MVRRKQAKGACGTCTQKCHIFMALVATANVLAGLATWHLWHGHLEVNSFRPRAAQAAQAAQATSCLCGQVVGAVPTTLQATERCSFKTLPATFLYDQVDGARLGPSEAKELCLDYGLACSGVTCSEGACEMRAGQEPMDSPSEEMSYVKHCSYSSEACPKMSAPGARDLRGTAIVIVAHNRLKELQSCLDSLLALPEASLFRVVVSLDDESSFAMMEAGIEEVKRAHEVDIQVWKATARAEEGEGEMQKWFKMNAGKIASHYWQVFERAFMVENWEQTIFTEEDLIFSPDFLALFRSTAGLLELDSSLWCISAWNDFGFKGTAQDPCRLQRTSYFPGLGFLLKRQAWLQIRAEWPSAPTMGWDYWMRVAFRMFDKECIVPEISRSHHAAAKGSSVSSTRQLQLFEAMAFATWPSSCNVSEPCNHFGNVSYLLKDHYEDWLREAIAEAPRTSVEQLQVESKKVLHVLPFQREDFLRLAEPAGLLPRNSRGSIPHDLRSEHYGVMLGKSKRRVPLLLVDRRSSRRYLRPAEQLHLEQGSEVLAGRQGWSCEEECLHRGAFCDKMQLYFLNDCNLLRTHFPCEAGCAHQVGNELPVYVPDSFQPTYRQCLLTFISPMNCTAKHESTSRLCACVRAPQVAEKANRLLPRDGHMIAGRDGMDRKAPSVFPLGGEFRVFVNQCAFVRRGLELLPGPNRDWPGRVRGLLWQRPHLWAFGQVHRRQHPGAAPLHGLQPATGLESFS